jgi:hypothetical protein
MPGVVNSAFYGMISKMDENIGRLLQFLKNRDLEKNTIILFMSDNGTAEGVLLNKEDNTINGYNAQMRGKKGSVYEGGHRVPLFIYNPLSKQNPTENNILASGIDILPTLIDLCNLKSSSYLEGISLVNLQDTSKINQRILFSDTQRGEHLEKNNPYVVMTKQWRLVNGTELYDINTDPQQRQNLVIQFPSVKQKLIVEYEKWWSKVNILKDQYQRVIVGSSKQKEICLSSHDLHVEKGYPAWNQEMVIKENGENGFWAIETEKSGLYQFELRRFPRESSKEIPLEYKVVRIEVDGKLYPIKKIKDRKKAIIAIKLEKGNHNIKTDFIADNKSINAGYVYIKRK